MTYGLRAIPVTLGTLKKARQGQVPVQPQQLLQVYVGSPSALKL